MWILKKLSDGTTRYLTSENKSCTIGRKNCDILNEDPSISRRHCTIYIARRSECPFTVRTLTGVWIVDEQSKYGTYIKNSDNWMKIDANQNTELTNGCVIRFGLMESIWRLEYKPLVVCLSGIPTEQKKEIDGILQAIDGCLKNAWSKECSLVIVNEITLTVKVVLALIHGVPIVTPDYLQKVVESIKNQAAFPKYEIHRPEIKEILLDKTLVSLDVNHNRKELFKGKKFIIPTQKQLETLKEIITSAGGSTELLSLSGDLKKFAEDNIIMIQLPFNKSGISEDLLCSFKEITLILKKKYERRVVPESEIAQAVAYASIEKYCNPKSNWFNLRLGERKQVDLGPVIVEETPMATEEVRNSPLGVIPSSATIYSMPQLDPSIELELIQNEAREFCVINNNEDLEAHFSMSDRKRTHSSSMQDHEFQQKKAKSQRISTIEEKEVSSNTENKNLRNKISEVETKSNQIKKDLSKTSYITSFFQKQSKSSVENISEKPKQDSADFWTSEKVSAAKRKISSKSDDFGEQSSNKKPKLSGKKLTMPEFKNDKPKEVVETVEQHKTYEKSPPFPSIRKLRHFQEENDFSGFFGKERTNLVDDLNNTIFSLTLISPDYLKEDGSLIDPPNVPVNVKRFKKQKIFSSLMLTSLEENEDEPLDAGWIEPHSGRLNISVA